MIVPDYDHSRAAAAAPLIRLQAKLHRHVSTTGYPVDRLLDYLLEPENLSAAWERVCAARGAGTPGPDGLVVRNIQPRISTWLAQLATDLRSHAYAPVPPRWVDVPKTSPSAGTRRLGILTIRDRVVHSALKQVLEPVFEPIFAAASFGFRPGRSVPAALAKASQLLAGPVCSLPFRWAMHLDVAACFDSIDHAMLLATLEHYLADAQVLGLLRRILGVGGHPTGWLWWMRPRGVIQGSALSPLLCNLYLHSLDEAVLRLAARRNRHLAALRYADDLLLLAATRRDARRGLTCVRKALRGLKLRLRTAHPRVYDVRSGIPWLGVQLQPRPIACDGRLTFGYVVPQEKIADMICTLAQMTTPPENKLDQRAFDLPGWLMCLNEQLQAWRQAYQFADNAADVFRVLDDQAQQRVGHLLRTVMRSTPSEVHRDCHRFLPRGFSTWQVGGVQMVVLSARAPRAPVHLVHRPPWMQGGRASSRGHSRANKPAS